MPDEIQLDYRADRLKEIQQRPLLIGVAGHANHGKTSVIRTLCRMPTFGQVDDLPGTTTRVEGRKLQIDNRTYMIVYDTPGLQHSSLAIERLGSEFRIEDVLDFFSQDPAYRHDYLALQQVLASHLVLYVVDGSCEPTEKLQDDFRLLARSKVPVIPLFNFVRGGRAPYQEAWLDFLGRNNYHLFVPYDAHVYNPEHERNLYEQIRVLLRDPLHKEFFDYYVRSREVRERNAAREAIRLIAQMVVDCAAIRHEARLVGTGDRKQVEALAAEAFEKAVRKRESEAFQGIVAAYEFPTEALENFGESTEAQALWKTDLFGPAMRRHLRIGIAAGAAAGATLGGTIDVMVGGASFLLGAAVGSLAGALAGALGGGMYNVRWDQPSQSLVLQCNDKTIQGLLERSLTLLRDVQSRGMANQADFLIAASPLRTSKADLKDIFRALEAFRRSLPLSRVLGAGTLIERLRDPASECVKSILPHVEELARRAIPGVQFVLPRRPS
jgi:hypothetical protein